jgi:hypothetical protein
MQNFCYDLKYSSSSVKRTDENAFQITPQLPPQKWNESFETYQAGYSAISIIPDIGVFVFTDWIQFLQLSLE